MIAIILALVLGILLNGYSNGGIVYPIGSVVAIVIMGIYLKHNQDVHFDELKKILENKEPSNNKDC